MHFGPNSRPWLEGTHAFLGASTPSWHNYDEDKLVKRAHTAEAARRGTKQHELAKDLIEMGIRLPDNGKTLNTYVNDCIGWRMTPEVLLFANEWAYGTTDAISFREGLLRLSDLKTGHNPAGFAQHESYAAFFCIWQDIKPVHIEMEFRIYQNDEVKMIEGDPDKVTHVISQINTFTPILREIREAGLA